MTKFKCHLNERHKMLELLHVIQSLAKHDDRIVIIIRNTTMTFSIPREPQNPEVWYDFNAESFFSAYNMEGVEVDNENENAIYVEVKTHELLPAIISIKKSLAFLEIKLKKPDKPPNNPILTISMQVQSTIDQENKVLITNQCPLILIPRIGWDDFDPNYSPQKFDIKVKLPRFQIFKRYIDIFKFVKTIKLLLRQDQTFTIEATHDATRLFTIFKNQDKAEDYKTKEDFKGEPVSVLVDQKKVSTWLHSLCFESPIKLYCYIQHQTQLKLFIRLRDDLLCSFVIPAEIDDFDDEQMFSEEEDD